MRSITTSNRTNTIRLVDGIDATSMDFPGLQPQRLSLWLTTEFVANWICYQIPWQQRLHLR